MNQDEQHIRLLATFHYVLAGVSALFALFPVFHLIIGIVFIVSPEVFGPQGQQPPAFFGWFMVTLAVVFMALGWIFAGLVLAAGRCLARRKCYLFCLVMAGIECMFMPFGTVLGVFTIIVLMRDSVKGMFSRLPGSAGAPSCI